MVEKLWKVWLTSRDPDREDIIQALDAAGCEVTLGRFFTDSWHYTEDALVDKVKDMDAIMISTGDGNITCRVMEAGKKFKVISKRTIGVGDIDVSAATVARLLSGRKPREVSSTITPVVLCSRKVLGHARRNILIGQSWSEW